MHVLLQKSCDQQSIIWQISLSKFHTRSLLRIASLAIAECALSLSLPAVAVLCAINKTAMFHNNRHSFTARKPVGGPLGQEGETKQTSDFLTKSFRNAMAMTGFSIPDTVS